MDHKTKLQQKKAAILAKAALIDAELRRRETREAAQERKRDTRRKLLIGAVTLARIERGRLPKEGVMRMMEQDLVRPLDRALFDLPPRVIVTGGSTAIPSAPEAPSETEAA